MTKSITNLVTKCIIKRVTQVYKLIEVITNLSVVSFEVWPFSKLMPSNFFSQGFAFRRLA